MTPRAKRLIWGGVFVILAWFAYYWFVYRILL